MGVGEVLCRSDHAKTQEIETGAAIHGALDQLQTVNVSLDRTVAPGVLKGSENCCFIAAEVLCEVCQRAPGAASRQPGQAAASRCRMMRQNSRAREAQVAISGDRRYSSSKYDLASSGCFNNSHATCRGDDRGSVEAESRCPTGHLRAPQCFLIQSRTMRDCPEKPCPRNSRQSWAALWQPCCQRCSRYF